MELDDGDRDGRLTAGSARAAARALSAAGSAGGEGGGLWGGWGSGFRGIRHELGRDNPLRKCTETFVNKDTRLG